MPGTVFNRYGQRKYLTSSEVDAFVKSARGASPDVRTFCCMMAFTGCRISEALSMTGDSIDFEAGHVIIRCLKKRGKQVFRAIPLPSDFLRHLRRWLGAQAHGSAPLWPWSRMTGYRRICEIMQAAGVHGSYATPKGLRHAFGVRAIQASVPLTLVQRWLGHADIKTTAIYTSAMGPEERDIAARMWRSKPMWSKSAKPGNLPPQERETGAEDTFCDPVDRGAAETLPPGQNTANARATLQTSAWIPRDESRAAPFVKPAIDRKKLTKTRLTQILYCPLRHFWLDRLSPAGSTRGASEGLNGPDGAQSGEQRHGGWERPHAAQPASAH